MGALTGRICRNHPTGSFPGGGTVDQMSPTSGISDPGPSSSQIHRRVRDGPRHRELAAQEGNRCSNTKDFCRAQQWLHDSLQKEPQDSSPDFVPPV